MNIIDISFVIMFNHINIPKSQTKQSQSINIMYVGRASCLCLLYWSLGTFGDTNVERKRWAYDVTLTSLTGACPISAFVRTASNRRHVYVKRLRLRSCHQRSLFCPNLDQTWTNCTSQSSKAVVRWPVGISSGHSPKDQVNKF